MRINNKSAVLPLIIINVIAFFLQMIVPGFTELFVLKQFDLFFRPWTIVSSMFLHGSFNHLFFNMYALLLFGSLLEQRIGQKKFLFAYFLTGILAGAVSSFIYSSALGASGAVMGIIGVLIILMPNLQLLLFFFIPMSLRTAGIIWILMDLFGVINPSGVANVAHLVGIFAGLGYGYYLKKKGSKTRKRVFRPKDVMDEEDLEQYMKYGRI